jgi:hypothetical protein
VHGVRQSSLQRALRQAWELGGRSVVLLGVLEAPPWAEPCSSWQRDRLSLVRGSTGLLVLDEGAACRQVRGVSRVRGSMEARSGRVGIAASRHGLPRGRLHRPSHPSGVTFSSLPGCVVGLVYGAGQSAGSHLLRSGSWVRTR